VLEPQFKLKLGYAVEDEVLLLHWVRASASGTLIANKIPRPSINERKNFALIMKIPFY
jgi:hypothetical protein